MVFVTGDTHGTNDITKLELLKRFIDINDFLIICGDVGVCWDGSSHDEYVQDELLSLIPCPILWIDGNHENFDLIESLPVSEWARGKVHVIKDRIIHLMRGEVYTIDNKTFFCFGGGQSIDKDYRKEGESWWPQEMPNQLEYFNGMNNLERLDNKVDYIVTHTAPRFICKRLVSSMFPGEEQLQHYLQLISEKVEFKKWFFGHWHIDTKIDNKYFALFQQIEAID